MVNWEPGNVAPRWQAVSLVFVLGASVAFAVSWFGAKAWLG